MSPGIMPHRGHRPHSVQKLTQSQGDKPRPIQPMNDFLDTCHSPFIAARASPRVLMCQLYAYPGRRFNGETRQQDTKRAKINRRDHQPRCLVRACDGVNLSSSQRRGLWNRFYTAAPRPRTPFEASYSDRKLRSRLAMKYGINETTVLKWRKRLSVEDMPMGPKERHSTVLSPMEKAPIGVGHPPQRMVASASAALCCVSGPHQGAGKLPPGRAEACLTVRS